MTAGAVGLFEDEPERLTGDRELVSFDQALIVGVADSDDLAGGQHCPSFCGWFFLDAFGNGLTQASQRLIKGPAVGLGDDLDQMGQSVGRGRRRSLSEHHAGSGLGVAEEITGDRQAEEPLVSGRGLGRLLPCSETAKLLQPALVQPEKLPVVVVVDRLDTFIGLGRSRPRLVLAEGLPRSHGWQGQRRDCRQEYSHTAGPISGSHLGPFSGIRQRLPPVRPRPYCAILVKAMKGPGLTHCES